VTINGIHEDKIVQLLLRGGGEKTESRQRVGASKSWDWGGFQKSSRFKKGKEKRSVLLGREKRGEELDSNRKKTF